jgi:hypothetical protein
MSRLFLALSLFPFALGAATTPHPAPVAQACCHTRTPCCGDACCKVAANCCKGEKNNPCARNCAEDPAA